MKLYANTLTILSLVGMTCTPGIRKANTTAGSFLTSDVLDDLQSDSTFDESNYPLRVNVTDEKAIEGITLVEDKLSSLYFYVYNANGKDLSEGLSSSRITMSTDPTNYDDVSYYDLTLLDETEDHRFYKFQINYIFPETYVNERAYCISEIEFDYGNGYSNGRHNTIGQNYFYSGQGEDLMFELKELNVVELNITPGSYRFDVINGNSTTFEDHYWDLFYITFPMRRDYGDLVGIKLIWNELSTDWTQWLTSNDLVVREEAGYYHKLIENEVIEYRNTDLFNLESLETIGSGTRIMYNMNPWHWGKEQGKDYENIKVIEKIKFDNLSSSTFNGYYFNDDTKKALNEEYYRTIGSSDFYVIRFAYRDFCNNTYKLLGETVKRRVQTEIQDCDVLTLTFLKDGKEYTLMASSQPIEIDPGWEVPYNPNWFEKLIKAIQDFINKALDVLGTVGFILVAIVVGVFVLWLLSLIVSAIKRIFKK